MSAYLFSGDLQIQEFLNLLKTASFPENSLIMAFSPASFVFGEYSFDETFLSKSDQGRIFSSHGELKWRCIDDRVRSVYLGTAPPPDGPLEDCSYDLEGLKPQTDTLLLWGVRTDKKNEWIEQRTPHRFEYPVRTDQYSRGRVRLQVEHWIDAFGMARFSRYCEIDEIEGDENATE